MGNSQKDTYLFQLGHNTRDGAIGDENSTANLDASGQAWVGAGDDSVVTLDSVVGRDFKGLVLLEFNALAVDEHASTDLRTLGVEHEGDVLVRTLLEGLVEACDLLAVGFVITVGEVETSDVHAGVDHLYEGLNRVASGSKGADDLGAAEVGINRFEDVVELDVLGVGGYFLRFHFDDV